MKKTIAAFLAILMLISLTACGNLAANTSSTDLQQSLDEFNDSWNALKEGVQAVGDDVGSAIDTTKNALEETKNSIEEVTGIGSVSKLLDGGNSFAYDCAVKWFQTYTADMDTLIEISGNPLLSAERKNEHTEDTLLGDCSKYTVTFLASIDPDGEIPIDDSVTITIYTANNGSGGYVVTKVSDDWSIFAGTFSSYGEYSSE